MQADNSRLEELYLKWFDKTASKQERAELFALFEAGVRKEDVSPLMEKLWKELQDDDSFSFSEREALANAILQQWPAVPLITGRRRGYQLRYIWTLAAAVLLMIGVVVIWRLMSQKKIVEKTEPVMAMASAEKIEPGRDGAILTLANGRQIVLDSATNGVIGIDGNAQILLQDNQVVYQNDNAENIITPELAYNVMATPRGRQFQLVLPDRTKVWLNAASSIRYPLTFAKEERRVIVSGEAYFEVVHNKNWPFWVQTDKQEVLALGTSFNVNAYNNQPEEKTTLVEGSVKVNSISSRIAAGNAVPAVVLNPGQQARLKNNRISVGENQADAAIAWKNGYFNLENIPFDDVMKQLERWYDIEVQYENGIPDLHFVGGLSRQMTLDALIRTLKMSEVQFRVEAGRRLIVYK